VRKVTGWAGEEKKKEGKLSGGGGPGNGKKPRGGRVRR